MAEYAWPAVVLLLGIFAFCSFALWLGRDRARFATASDVERLTLGLKAQGVDLSALEERCRKVELSQAQAVAGARVSHLPPGLAAR